MRRNEGKVLTLFVTGDYVVQMSLDVGVMMLKFPRIGSIGLLLLAIGCVAQKPAPLVLPALSIHETHYLGDAVSGPRTGTLAADAQKNAFVARVQLYAATNVSMNELDPLGAAVRLVVSTRDRQPVLATGQLTSSAKWATSTAVDSLAKQLESAPPYEVAKLKEMSLAIARGSSGSIVTENDRAHRSIEILLTHSAGANNPSECEIAVGISGTSKDELAILRPIAVNDGFGAALVIPIRPADSAAKFLAAIIHVSPAPNPPDDAFTALLEDCTKDVARESDAAEQRIKARLASPAAKGWPTFDAALPATSDPKTRRAGMVYLATQTGAAFSRDVYLVADDPTLAKLLEDVASRVANPSTPDRSDAALAWILDSSTFQTLGKMLSDNQLSGELAAVLTDFAGEAGRHAGSIEEITRKLSTRDELANRLLAENAIYLEDNSPAARVRAYDWLKSHGKAPAGFDPLGSVRQRRDALQSVK